MTTIPRRQNLPQHPIDLDSQQARQLLDSRMATLEPCSKKTHKHQGYIVTLVQPDDPGDPTPVFTNNRVLFFGCSACNIENFEELMPQCPEEHRPFRGWVNNQPQCHVCNVRRVGSRFQKLH